MVPIELGQIHSTGSLPPAPQNKNSIGYSNNQPQPHSKDDNLLAWFRFKVLQGKGDKNMGVKVGTKNAPR